MRRACERNIKRRDLKEGGAERLSARLALVVADLALRLEIALVAKQHHGHRVQLRTAVSAEHKQHTCRAHLRHVAHALDLRDEWRELTIKRGAVDYGVDEKKAFAVPRAHESGRDAPSGRAQRTGSTVRAWHYT